MFEIRVEGETVAKIEEQVVAVRLMSARGELYKAGMTNTDGAIDIKLDKVMPGDPVRLDQLEAFQARQRAELVQGLATGQAEHTVDNSIKMSQGNQDYTLRPGGVDSEQSQQGNFPPPSLDLAQGISPTDGDTLTARINSYNEHGDAQRAIDDNQPNNQPQTAEQGATPEPESTPAAEQGQGDTASQNELNTGIDTVNQEVPSGDTPPTESTPEGNSGATPQNAPNFSFGMSEGTGGGTAADGPTPTPGTTQSESPEAPPAV